jgi:hypothetical protein
VVKQLLLFQANVDIKNNVISDNGINYHLLNHVVVDAHVRVELDGSLDEWAGVVGGCDHGSYCLGSLCQGYALTILYNEKVCIVNCSKIL